MKSTKAVVFILIFINLLTIACSMEEEKLLGEWQSSTPTSVHLSITKGTIANDDFHEGFTWTWSGGTYTQYWRSKNGVLYLSSGGFDSCCESSMMFNSARKHKVIELTSDKLVLEGWTPDKANTPYGIYEFHRVK